MPPSPLAGIFLGLGFPEGGAGGSGTAAACFCDDDERRSGRPPPRLADAGLADAGLADAGLAGGVGCDRFCFNGMRPMSIGKVFLTIKSDT